MILAFLFASLGVLFVFVLLSLLCRYDLENWLPSGLLTIGFFCRICFLVGR